MAIYTISLACDSPLLLARYRHIAHPYSDGAVEATSPNVDPPPPPLHFPSFSTLLSLISPSSSFSNHNRDCIICCCCSEAPAWRPDRLSLSHAGSASGGLASGNFANFDHFPKSCSADFGAFGSSTSSSSQGNTAASAREPLESASAAADRYAAFADLDSNLCSSTNTEQGKLLPSRPSLSQRFRAGYARTCQPGNNYCCWQLIIRDFSLMPDPFS